MSFYTGLAEMSHVDGGGVEELWLCVCVVWWCAIGEGEGWDEGEREGRTSVSLMEAAIAKAIASSSPYRLIITLIPRHSLVCITQHILNLLTFVYTLGNKSSYIYEMPGGWLTTLLSIFPSKVAGTETKDLKWRTENKSGLTHLYLIYPPWTVFQDKGKIPNIWCFSLGLLYLDNVPHFVG